MNRIPRCDLPKEKSRDVDERKKSINDENIDIYFAGKRGESDETKQIGKPTNVKRIGRFIRGKSISWSVPLNLNSPLVKDPR